MLLLLFGMFCNVIGSLEWLKTPSFGENSLLEKVADFQNRLGRTPDPNRIGGGDPIRTG